MRRTEALRAAQLIDRGKIIEAKEILEALKAEYDCVIDSEEGDKDTIVLVYSLLGILKQDSKNHKEQIEGLKLNEKAKEMSMDIPGGALMYERRKWLFVPNLIQSHVLFSNDNS